MLQINEGGISIYGAVIGGVLGARRLRLHSGRMPILRGLDAAAFGLLLGMAIGRIGDLINGEHVAKPSDLPWARDLHQPRTAPAGALPGTAPNAGRRTHPATTYEMIGDLLIIGHHGVHLRALLAHSTGRHVLHRPGAVLGDALRRELPPHRQRRCVYKDWMTFPQVVSMIMFAIGMVGLIWTILRGDQPAPAGTEIAAGTPENPLDRKPASSRP